MDLNAVKSSYARWAPVYDKTFGAITEAGRRRAVAHINKRGGKVLEVGIGTGLSLEQYDPGIEVTGIDFSDEMLAKARRRVERGNLANVVDLRQMDARELDFPDASFDTVAAMHIVSVVPEPERVMAEMARVCKPGGQIVITNHFARERGVMAGIERLMAPFEKTLGWHSDFPLARVTGEPNLHIVSRKPLPPLGMMTFLVMEKDAAA
ncbi:methyltransferase domain-containing protein [Sediminimonas sp.]|uniref:class I SAM-dependent methyltransferase n=1 Tax=Sediminimonas sp. TaxID=2823379 RepID=UPI0025FB6D5A|nr:methyltransferase domain-containing protein [Sediminimonas sp.]